MSCFFSFITSWPFVSLSYLYFLKLGQTNILLVAAEQLQLLLLAFLTLVLPYPLLHLYIQRRMSLRVGWLVALPVTIFATSEDDMVWLVHFVVFL
jgi:hypothetical protein